MGELASIMALIDTDSNGEIDFDEFLSLYAVKRFRNQEEEEAMRGGKLPFWLSWLVVFGLKFSRPVVHAWLTSFAFSVLNDALLFEPVKVGLASVLGGAAAGGAGFADALAFFR